MNHTPGPWVAQIFNSVDEAQECGSFEWASPGFLDGKVGCVWRLLPEGGMTGLPGSIEVSAADAFLIAEAPNLLDALKIAMEYLPHIQCQWAVKARKAISKAEGRDA